jgi:hypothetical protein
MAYTTIDDPSEYFNTVTWSGNGADDRNITGVGFQPDTVWYKERNNAVSHRWVDAVRGIGKELYVDIANAEFSASNELQAYQSDGFQIGSDVSINASGDTYVGWCWKASGSTASNTDGVNASTVSANQTAGFSIVTYTRNSDSVTTVGHGLGKAPKVKIEKDRDTNSTSWSFITNAIDGTDDYGFLDTTATFASTTSGFTSTVFRSAMGANQGAILAYVFAEIQGYSKFGTYTGNAAVDGPFVYTGFKPAWIMTKSTTATASWTILDNKRDPFNVTSKRLFADDYQAESDSTSGNTDFLSNGFKIRTSHSGINESNGVFIYMAFAEHPFVSSKGVPVTAR